CRQPHHASLLLLSPPCFFSSLRHPRCSPLFPYTTLFRSLGAPPRGAVLSRRPWHLPGSTRPKPPTTATPCTRLPKGLPYNSRLRSEEHTSELQSLAYLVCRLLLEKKNKSHIVSPTVSNKI